jgi:hypothetical protein
MRRTVADAHDAIALAYLAREMCARGGVDVRNLRRLTHETEETIERMEEPWRVW